MLTVFTSESRSTQAAISFTCKAGLTYRVVLAGSLATSILKKKKTVNDVQEQTLLLFRFYDYIEAFLSNATMTAINLVKEHL